MWHSFVQWFAEIIQILYDFTGTLGVPNYGLAIILMTIAIKLIMFPLTQKQMKSMRAMQELQPKMKYIQEKYKEDPQIMQTKVMELYKEHGVNPFGGCLPLLIQMPIFIAFYQSLFNFNFRVVEHARFLWIPNIGSPDPYHLLAVFAAATTYLQQRISMVDTNDPTQKSMLYIMPLFLGYIAWTMPAGLPLYWVMFNILGIAQQLYVNRSSKLLQPDTGTGIRAEAVEETKQVVKSTMPVTTPKQETGRDKGGKKKNGGSNNRKKGKKR
ncbi:MAG: YidC/Oxa1 family membrane protein insertase [Syntrophomonadaceae bacterium]